MDRTPWQTATQEEPDPDLELRPVQLVDIARWFEVPVSLLFDTARWTKGTINHW